jgi:hypothetical protein
MYFVGEGKKEDLVAGFWPGFLSPTYLCVTLLFSPFLLSLLSPPLFVSPLKKESVVLTVFALESLALGFFGVGF